MTRKFPSCPNRKCIYWIIVCVCVLTLSIFLFLTIYLLTAKLTDCSLMSKINKHNILCIIRQMNLNELVLCMDIYANFLSLFFNLRQHLDDSIIDECSCISVCEIIYEVLCEKFFLKKIYAKNIFITNIGWEP
jgi:hypothetical protein